jgi:hypothetical protein
MNDREINIYIYMDLIVIVIVVCGNVTVVMWLCGAVVAAAADTLYIACTVLYCNIDNY